MYLLGFFILLFSSNCFADVFINGFFAKENVATSDICFVHENEFVVSLEKALVYGDGAIINQNGEIFSDTETYGNDQQKRLYRTIVCREIQPFFGRLVVISSPGQENWYHWLLQVLPRLKILAESGVMYDALYINNLKHPWQKKSLEIVLKVLNIPESKLFLTQGDDTAIQASTLIVPSVSFAPTKGRGIFPKWATSFLRDCFLIQNNLSYPKKIYISRSKASSRRIINEDYFTDILKQKGFVVVHLEDLSPIEQAQLYHGADIIIGSHGSSFANLVFTKEQTLVIEIDHGSEGSQRSYFGRFAKRFGCNYVPFYVDTVAEDQLDQDFTIDCSIFSSFYDSIVK